MSARRRVGLLLLACWLVGCSAPEAGGPPSDGPAPGVSPSADSGTRAPNRRAGPPRVSTREELREYVSRLRSAAKGLVLDGDARDWEPFHGVDSRVGPSFARPVTQLRLNIAPVDGQLWFCVQYPDRWKRWWDHCAWYRLSLTFELAPESSYEIEVSTDRVEVLEWKGDSKYELRVPEGAIETVEGYAVEGRVDLSGLATFRSGRVPIDVLDPARSQWVRVRLTVGLRSGSGESGDGPSGMCPGPAVASCWLDPSIFAPGPPRWDAGRDPILVDAGPWLRDRWYVVQGAREWPTHERTDAYDLGMRDERMWPCDPYEDTEDPWRFYAWDAPVLAPSAGVVLSARDGTPDKSARSLRAVRRTLDLEDANEVAVVGPLAWSISHLRMGSIAVHAGDSVGGGQVIGRVGNSGFSTGPHIHVEVGRGRDQIPDEIFLQNVIVGLNAGDDDPWRLRYDLWLMTTGHFIEGAGPEGVSR